jgi:hypothetical protein
MAPGITPGGDEHTRFTTFLLNNFIIIFFLSFAHCMRALDAKIPDKHIYIQIFITVFIPSTQRCVDGINPPSPGSHIHNRMQTPKIKKITICLLYKGTKKLYVHTYVYQEKGTYRRTNII